VAYLNVERKNNKRTRAFRRKTSNTFNKLRDRAAELNAERKNKKRTRVF
jgi:hypothetical protein